MIRHWLYYCDRQHLILTSRYCKKIRSVSFINNILLALTTRVLLPQRVGIIFVMLFLLVNITYHVMKLFVLYYVS